MSWRCSPRWAEELRVAAHAASHHVGEGDIVSQRGRCTSAMTIGLPFPLCWSTTPIPACTGIATAPASPKRTGLTVSRWNPSSPARGARTDARVRSRRARVRRFVQRGATGAVPIVPGVRHAGPVTCQGVDVLGTVSFRFVVTNKRPINGPSSGDPKRGGGFALGLASRLERPSLPRRFFRRQSECRGPEARSVRPAGEALQRRRVRTVRNNVEPQGGASQEVRRERHVHIPREGDAMKPAARERAAPRRAGAGGGA